jgi:lipid-binding SYLF domain-containing protein
MASRIVASRGAASGRTDLLSHDIKEKPMKNLRRFFLAAVFAVATSVSLGAFQNASAATAEDLNKEAQHALDKLLESNPVAKEIAGEAEAVLIFPNIVKAGLVFGGAYGEGLLQQGGEVKNYYNSVTGSWGLQAGAQSYGYVVFLMNNKAVDYLTESRGWEIGVGPTVVVVDDGIAKNLSSSTLKDDAYAFIFDQKGLMAGINIEGTKITQIRR